MFIPVFVIVTNSILALLGPSPPQPDSAQPNKHCDHDSKAPNKDACLVIMNNGVEAWSLYAYANDEWWSGNCRVKFDKGIDNGPISGTDLKGAIQIF